MRLKPVYDGYTVKLPNGSGQLEDVGSLEAFACLTRLVSIKAFVYEDEAGSVSLRLERKRRGSDDGYWIAYKRRSGKLHKTYVCEAYALDPINLDQAAQRLLQR